MRLLANSQGKLLVNSQGKAYVAPQGAPEPPKLTGTVDTVGLTALGWDAEDIAWLQAHVWWNAEDDAYWAVTPANLAFGPNGATPLTWENRATIRNNPDVRYFPKFDPSPSSDTSWAYLLQNYQYLYAIPTHGWDTSKVTSLQYLFYNCINLVSVGDLSGWDTSKVTSLLQMFNNCYLLNSVGDLSEWDTSKVTNVSSMFNYCYLLSSVGDLSEWDTAKVTNMSSMFQYCYMLSSLDLSGWDTSLVTNMSNMFNVCSNLTSVGDLSGWDTSKVTSLLQMFSSCGRLTSVGDLSEWDTAKVTNMSGMFSNCGLLSSVGDLSEWDTSSVTNVSSMFSNCRNLISLNIADWDVTKVTTPQTIFVTNFRLRKIDLSGWDLSGRTQNPTGTSNSEFYQCTTTVEVVLGPKFFNGSPTTYYWTDLRSWKRESVVQSLYTNQTQRDTSSRQITIRLSSAVYDQLTQEDIANIASKNFTLVRVA